MVEELLKAGVLLSWVAELFCGRVGEQELNAVARGRPCSMMTTDPTPPLPMEALATPIRMVNGERAEAGGNNNLEGEVGRLWSKLAEAFNDACAIMEVRHHERMGAIVRKRDGYEEQIRRLAASGVVDKSEEKMEREAVRELREIEDTL